jgi:hypothetical protein
MTQNEIDITMILKELGKSKSYPEKITAALERLLVQLPKPVEAVPAAVTLKAEQERHERN